MPGWDVEDVPGPDGELRAVVHPAIHDTGHREPHMMELAARCPGDGPHVRGPAPAGLQHEPTDHELPDSYRGRRPFREREGLVRSRQVLHPRTICVHPGLPRSAGRARDAGAAPRLESRVRRRDDRGVTVTARPGPMERGPGAPRWRPAGGPWTAGDAPSRPVSAGRSSG